MNVAGFRNLASQTLALNHVKRFVWQFFLLISFLLASSSLVLDSPKDDTGS